MAELIQTSTDFLQKNSIKNPRLNAELLLGQILNLERMELYLNYDKPLSPQELIEYRNLVRRRIGHEPLQYILGETEFMSLNFLVSPAVLIPRADTETLVEWVIESSRSKGKKWILDIGTGSGNIAISLAYNLPEIQVVGIDISNEALKIAAKNVKTHLLDKRVFLLQTDLLNQEFANIFKNRFDVIVSNPPYIKKEEFDLLDAEITKFEPQIALKDVKNNGFFYQRIAQITSHMLKKDGAVFVEMGYKYQDEIKSIFQNHGFSDLTTRRDLAGIDRVLSAKRKG